MTARMGGGSTWGDFITFCSVRSLVYCRALTPFPETRRLLSRPRRSSDSVQTSPGHLDIAFDDLLAPRSCCYSEGRGSTGDPPTPEHRSRNNSLFFVFTPFKIVNFTNQNLTALGPEHALLLPMLRSHTSLFPCSPQGLICDRADTRPRP